MRTERELDIVVYGATGFTGRLVAEYLNNTYGVRLPRGGRISQLTDSRKERQIMADVSVLAAARSQVAEGNACGAAAARG